MNTLCIDVEKTQGKARRILVQSDMCHGCLLCQMVCSLSYTNRINPANAYIRVEREERDAYRFRVGFTTECRDSCHLCATVCPYQCLTSVGREEA